MSEITQNIVVQPIDATFIVDNNNINFTPTDISMNIYAGGLGMAGGSSGQLQYNNGGILGGIPTATYVSGNLNLGSTANIKITGGSANFALITDGAGNLSWEQVANANYATYANYANFAGNAFSVAGANVTGAVAYAGNVTIAAQANITSLGTLTGLTVNGTSNLTNVSNVVITGGTNGQYLQTNGSGGLAWVSGGGAGNGVVGGSNTQIQYNNSGNFAGSPNFTFNNTTNVVTSTGFTGPVISLPYGTENVSLITAQTGTYNFDFISSSIRYTTSNAAANLTLNFRGNSTVSSNTILANGQSVTGTYVLATGSTPYGVTAVQVDGSAQTIKWVGGNVPSQFANVLNSYTFTIIKTSTTPTYTVFGSSTRYS